MRRQFVLWKIWQQTYDEVRQGAAIDVVLMLNVDDCSEAVALIGSPFRTISWMGITLKPTFHFGRMGVSAPKPRLSPVRGWFFRRALHEKHLVGMLTIDPTLAAYAKILFTKIESQKLVFLPDPAVDHILPPMASAREAFGIPLDAKVVLAYGALSERKGIGMLIECASNAECPSNLFVLMAGKQAPEITAILAGQASSALKKQNRLKIIDDYISDSEEACLLAAADIMWVGYQGFYNMSGILVLAARHGIPCIVSNYGIAEYLMRKHEFGLTVDPNNRNSVLAALKETTCDGGQLAIKGDRAKAVFSRHTVAEFQRTISVMIETQVPSILRTNEPNGE